MSTMTFSTPELEPYLVLAQELMRHVYSEESPEEINAWLLAQMDRLSGSKEESAILLWDDSFELYERIMAQRAKDALIPESERKTLTWPWASWSALIDPLGPGMLAVMAAADGEGKTLYAECIAEGCQVVFLHFELNPTLMLDRRTVRHSGIPRRILISGQLTDLQENERKRANDRIRPWPGGITYIHTPGWTVERALSEVRALRSRELCDVFVVDYLEKASPS
ncbi:MAG: DnaB-like helicase C-terminal domain-containing protein, partial [Planctomycetota bacterium]